ncbi:transcriptional regulator, partial [Rhizobium ruizarguesonis]
GSQALSKQKAYQFGDFRLLPESQALLYKGQSVALGGRGFDILTLLVARAGEVVSKADLFSHVWPDYIVHDHNPGDQAVRRFAGSRHRGRGAAA